MIWMWSEWMDAQNGGLVPVPDVFAPHGRGSKLSATTKINPPQLLLLPTPFVNF